VITTVVHALCTPHVSLHWVCRTCTACKEQLHGRLMSCKHEHTMCVLNLISNAPWATNSTTHPFILQCPMLLLLLPLLLIGLPTVQLRLLRITHTIQAAPSHHVLDLPLAILLRRRGVQNGMRVAAVAFGCEDKCCSCVCVCLCVWVACVWLLRRLAACTSITKVCVCVCACVYVRLACVWLLQHLAACTSAIAMHVCDMVWYGWMKTVHT